MEASINGDPGSLIKDFSSRYKRLAVVSNRLPVTIDSEGGMSMSSGGLVTALAPVLQKYGGLWIGWSGTHGEAGQALAGFSAEQGYDLKAVPLNPKDVDDFYYGFSNEVLWPLFHGFPGRCRFEPDYWRAYERVNESFAATIAESTDESDFIWIQDYHLLLVAQKLKALDVKRTCGFYLHIPFPPPDIFFSLPWRAQILEGLAAFDSLGFQTSWDVEKFRSCLRSSVPPVPGNGGARNGAGRRRAAATPISIDFEEFSKEADLCRRSPEVSWMGPLNKGCRVLLGVDRLDYTKGIPERLKAYRQLLQDFPEHRERTALLQVVVPSRERIDTYQELKEEIERLVGEINGQFATPGWTPIRYLYRSLSRRELVSTYIQADMAVITPLRDGMNLVAKEYCACKNDLNGILLLSEFAGASRQLESSALLVNPYDIEAMARTIDYALRLSRAERRARMFAARERIRSEDISWWLSRCLASAMKPAASLRGETKRSRTSNRGSRERRLGLKASSRQNLPKHKTLQTSLRKKRRLPSSHWPEQAS